MTFAKTFLRDESGASAAEYALILAIVGAAIVLGAVALGEAIGNELTDTATCIASTDHKNEAACNNYWLSRQTRYISLRFPRFHFRGRGNPISFLVAAGGNHEGT